MKKLIFFICLLASLPLSAQVDRREVRAGNRDFKKEKYRNAEVDYKKALLKDSLSVAGNYNLASTLYWEENYDAAEQALKTISESASDRADYHFNLGDVALKKKDYGAAVQAFKKALMINPGDIEAKENYIYAKKMLQNQQQNQDQQNQDQNQDQQDQDQNQDQQQDKNQDQNQDQQQDQNQDQNQAPQEQKISPQQAEQILKAIQAEEQKTQDKVNKEKAAAVKTKQKEKNW